MYKPKTRRAYYITVVCLLRLLDWFRIFHWFIFSSSLYVCFRSTWL